MGSPDDAEDLLQGLFEKAILHKEQFCSLTNARAWLFQVARNGVIDYYRLRKDTVALPESLALEDAPLEAVDALSECLPRGLSELAEADRIAITLCDLNGVSQQEFADSQRISLAAAKSRIQRARRRMRAMMEKNCQVRRNDSGQVCCFVPRPSLD